ncbi:MAG: AAC(3) family N-acetyltransferase [Clostridiales bacterium]|nr:AAC(3) family N-acetyltransferase [Clostridiales bacterium]
MNTRDQMIRDLRALGVQPGDALLMHSSMKSLGVTETPAYILDTVQLAVGDAGTLLLPALSYATVNKQNPVWSYNDTPACVGLLPETFRHLPDVVRSVHPTHSVCARGALADTLTKDHRDDRTPVGERSPFRKLPGVGGKILMLGCGMGPMTFMHGVEEAAPAMYVLLPDPWHYTMIERDGSRYEVDHHRHGINRYGAQRYARAESLLDASELHRGRVLGAEAYLIDSHALLKKGCDAIRRDPYFFLELHRS